MYRICRGRPFYCIIAYSMPSRSSLLSRRDRFHSQNICSGATTAASPLLESIVDMNRCPIHDPKFAIECRKKMDYSVEDGEGLCHLADFLTPEGTRLLQAEANSVKSQAFYSDESHNAYLEKEDQNYPANHARNMQQRSTKRLVAADQMEFPSSASSSGILLYLYKSPLLKYFVQEVIGVKPLYLQADPMNKVHLNYFSPGDELGWHFDNSEFFVNLLLQAPTSGGEFEFVARSRTETDPNYSIVKQVLDGRKSVTTVEPTSGSLLIFRGKYSIHRVRQVIDGERITAILNYEQQPGVIMNEYTRKKFFGRTLDDVQPQNTS